MKYISIVLVFIFLISFASAYPITKITPQFSGYNYIGSTGNESCWADVSLSGKDNRQITISSKPLGLRNCCTISDVSNNCNFQTISAPSSMPIQLPNGTTLISLPQSLGSFIFNIPLGYDSWLKRFKIGTQSIFFGQFTNYQPDNQVNTTERDSDGFVLNTAFLNMSNDTDQNLWAYLPREEGWVTGADGTTNSIAHDVSRNQRIATLSAYTPGVIDNGYTPSPYGTAWRHTSASNPVLGQTFITFGNAPENVLSKGENYTIMFWFNNTLAIGGSTRTLIKQGGASSLTASQQTYRVEQSPDGNITITLGNGSTSQQIVRQINGSSGGIPVEQWHFFAMSGNTSRFIAYVDTINLTALSGNARNMTKPYYSLDNTTLIGVARTNLANEAFDGAIDEIMYFNRSMNGSQIIDYYNNRTNRYRYSGTFTIPNVNLSGNDSVRITVNTTTIMGTKINVSINDNVQHEINTTSNTTFSYTGTTNEANITFSFYPNNDSGYFFYSPYIRGTISVDSAPKSQYPSIIPYEYPTDPGTYTNGFILTLNATITDDNGLSAVNLQFNGVNQSLTQSGDVFTFTTPIVVWANTTYFYHWGATNGIDLRTTVDGNYTVNFIPLTNFTGQMCVGWKHINLPNILISTNKTC